MSDDKRSDLIARKEEHNANIIEMNNDLNALEGIKIISCKIRAKKLEDNQWFHLCYHISVDGLTYYYHNSVSISRLIEVLESVYE